MTSFTVAHSITLSLAALSVISLPSRLVESTIALSVVLAALNNLKPLVAERRWAVAFAFGLIHGFGFASVLADLGLPQGALLLALVGFNLGVEIGQLAIVSGFPTIRLRVARQLVLSAPDIRRRLGRNRARRRGLARRARAQRKALAVK